MGGQTGVRRRFTHERGSGGFLNAISDEAIERNVEWGNAMPTFKRAGGR